MNNEILLIVNNIQYNGWLANNIRKSLEFLSDSFSVSLSQKFNSNGSVNHIPIDRGDEVQILIDRELVVNGFVETRDISYDSDSHSISITGRSRICDLIDNSLVGNLNLNKGYKVSSLVRTILKSYGMNDFKIDFVNVADDTYDEDFDCGLGENAWDVLSEYLKKKSIYATTTGNSDIILFRGNFGNTDQSLFHNITKNTELNNVISGRENKDDRERYNSIKVISQSESIVSEGNYSDISGKAFDNNIRSTRKLEILSKNSLTTKECKDLAIFNTNIRQARGFGYEYKVQGFRQSENGLLWLPNYLVRVKDEFFGIDDYFLIKSVEFVKDLDNGTITNLSLVDKNSYTIVEPIIEEEKNIELDF